MLHSDVISILSAVITGGFVLIFIEISNRKNRENDCYRQLMSPFIRKLSAYFKYISWVCLHITGPKPDTPEEKKFKETLRVDIAKYGSQLIVRGGRYDVDTFSAKELEDLCSTINHVWYMHDRWSLDRLKLAGASISQELVAKELKILNESYLAIPESVSKIAKVSGDFYADEYWPLQDEPYYHELLAKLYRRQSFFVCLSLLLVLVTLCVQICVEVSIGFMRTMTIIIVLLFALCVCVLFVKENKQLQIMKSAEMIYKKLSITNMKIQIKKMLEPIGLILLIGAFIWQTHSLYENQLIQYDKIYKVEQALDYILQSECDEAMRDNARYKGSATMSADYKGMLNFIQSYYEDAERITDWKDKAGTSWLIQCILFIIGSGFVIAGKWPEKQHE